MTCPRLRGWLLAGSYKTATLRAALSVAVRGLDCRRNGDTVLDAVLGEVLEQDAEGSGMDLCVILRMLN